MPQISRKALLNDQHIIYKEIIVMQVWEFVSIGIAVGKDIYDVFQVLVYWQVRSGQWRKKSQNIS
jgi:hypothetical protein